MQINKDEVKGDPSIIVCTVGFFSPVTNYFNNWARSKTQKIPCERHIPYTDLLNMTTTVTNSPIRNPNQINTNKMFTINCYSLFF